MARQLVGFMVQLLPSRWHHQPPPDHEMECRVPMEGTDYTIPYHKSMLLSMRAQGTPVKHFTGRELKQGGAITLCLPWSKSAVKQVKGAAINGGGYCNIWLGYSKRGEAAAGKKLEATRRSKRPLGGGSTHKQRKKREQQQQRKHPKQWYKHEQMYAHQLMAGMYLGRPSSDKMEVSHKCNHAWCIGWRHLQWCTHKDNMQN